jgi:hypothetical protein
MPFLNQNSVAIQKHGMVHLRAVHCARRYQPSEGKNKFAESCAILEKSSYTCNQKNLATTIDGVLNGTKKEILMKDLLRNLACALVIFPLASAADIGIDIEPVPIQPSVPAIESDDASVVYNYTFITTGYWEGDPEYLNTALLLSCSESIVRHKTNNTIVATSRSHDSHSGIHHNFCPDPNYVWNRTVNCVNGNCTYSGDGLPLLGACWYTAVYGNDPCSDLSNDIREGPTLTDFYCGATKIGDVNIGRSWFLYTLNPNGEIGGACGIIPTHHLYGDGGIYQLQLTLTPGCPSVEIPPLPPRPSRIDYTPSRTGIYCEQATLTGVTNFQFVLHGEANKLYGIQFSTNLIDWVDVTNITLGSTSALCSLVVSSSSALGFYRAHDEYLYECTEPVGFQKRLLATGWNMLANPFFSPTNVQISTLLPNVPSSTVLQFWGFTNWGPSTTFSSGSWDHPNWTLPFGGGARIQVPTNTTITFVGQVVQGKMTNAIPSGSSVSSSLIPKSGTVTQLGLTSLGNGDWIEKWNGSSFICYTNSSGSWSPSTPTLSVGESIVIHATSLSFWSRTFDTTDYIALYTPYVELWGGYGGDLIVWSSTAGTGTISRPDAVWEVYDNDQLVTSVPVTDDSLSTEDGYVVLSNYGGDQGSWLKVRYRNGDSYSPFSNQVQPW